MDLNDKVAVTQMWLPPSKYEALNVVLKGKSLTETCPNGIFVRFLSESQTLLSVRNATREEAKQMMWRDGK